MQTAVTAIWPDGTSQTFNPSQNVLPVDGVFDPRFGGAAVIHAAGDSLTPGHVNIVTLDNGLGGGCVPVDSGRQTVVLKNDATHSDHPPGQNVAIARGAARSMLAASEKFASPGFDCET